MIRTKHKGNSIKLLLCSFLLLLVSCSAAGKGSSSKVPPESDKFIRIEGGVYTPLFAVKDDLKQIPVKAFLLQKVPVTKSDFLSFVKTQPQWRRSLIKAAFADGTYLHDWPSDLEIKSNTINQPVVFVSWFAAKAYCKWIRARLPTVAEWEYAAMASETSPDGRDDSEFIAKILAWHATPNPEQLADVGHGFKNYWGVYDMHGLVWEWTSDFNTMLITGESREDSGLNRELFCGAGAVAVNDALRANYLAFLRSGFRSSLEGNFSTQNLGFRCAKDLENSK